MAKKANTNIIKGKTSSGIQFCIDKRIRDDARLLFWFSRIQNENLDAMERNNALFSLLELIFGSGEGLSALLNEVAAKHDGVADIESLTQELTEMFEALNVKNS